MAEQLPPGRWLGKWLRDEKFWMDITTRTISSGFGAGTLALLAILAGFGTHPQRVRILDAVLFGLAGIGLLLLTINRIQRLPRSSTADVVAGEMVVMLGRGRRVRRIRYKATGKDHKAVFADRMISSWAEKVAPKSVDDLLAGRVRIPSTGVINQMPDDVEEAYKAIPYLPPTW